MKAGGRHNLAPLISRPRHQLLKGGDPPQLSGPQAEIDDLSPCVARDLNGLENELKRAARSGVKDLDRQESQSRGEFGHGRREGRPVPEVVDEGVSRSIGRDQRRSGNDSSPPSQMRMVAVNSTIDESDEDAHS